MTLKWAAIFFNRILFKHSEYGIIYLVVSCVGYNPSFGYELSYVFNMISKNGNQKITFSEKELMNLKLVRKREYQKFLPILTVGLLLDPSPDLKSIVKLWE